MNPLHYKVNPERIRRARLEYGGFIQSCRASDASYRLTPRAEATPYALCFAIFGYHLLNERELISENIESWNEALRNGLAEKKHERSKTGSLQNDKPFLQLLTFTLSALSILGTLEREPLVGEVKCVLPEDIGTALNESRCLVGAPRSGNQAMFIGILLLYARDLLGLDTQSDIDKWVSLHLQNVNAFGFWGRQNSMSHLQFQNGYHQYELLEYLNVNDAPWDSAAASVASLADDDGHFAPYPGGGGCYDYDAVFLLTATNQNATRYRDLLIRSACSILNEQNSDGGFCESRRIRPRTVSNLRASTLHVLTGRGCARLERLRSVLTLLRPTHNRIHTHWSEYSREWDESDLWDSWFRMLTVARIDCALDPERAKDWGFINFPGIGFHRSLRKNIIL